jgi:excisionase family DNA binding protein
VDNLPRAERLLTPAEVARALGIPRNTLYNWLKHGRLRGVKIGRQWRIQPATLTAYVQATQHSDTSHHELGHSP